MTNTSTNALATLLTDKLTTVLGQPAAWALAHPWAIVALAAALALTITITLAKEARR